MREINRRNFVITNLSGATILLAGCLDESSGDDPEGVAKDMLKEIFEPDRQGAFKLSHRDGPASETIPDFVLMPDPSTEIENIETEITEEEENRVVVELTFDIDYVGETPKKSSRTFELRTNDDDKWRVWSM